MEFFDPHFHIWDLETPAAEGAGYPLASGHDAAILFPPGGKEVKKKKEKKSVKNGAAPDIRVERLMLASLKFFIRSALPHPLA